MTNQIEISSLRSHIGYRLRVVSNAVSHSFAMKLSRCKITIAEWVILREMYSLEAHISPSTIAETTGLTRGAVSKIINRLFVKELVVRSESQKDRRYQEIKLTEKAKKLIPELTRVADDNDEKFFSVLTAPEKNNLMDILIKLAKTHTICTTPIE